MMLAAAARATAAAATPDLEPDPNREVSLAGGGDYLAGEHAQQGEVDDDGGNRHDRGRGRPSAVDQPPAATPAPATQQPGQARHSHPDAAVGYGCAARVSTCPTPGWPAPGCPGRRSWPSGRLAAGPRSDPFGEGRCRIEARSHLVVVDPQAAQHHRQLRQPLDELRAAGAWQRQPGDRGPALQSQQGC